MHLRTLRGVVVATMALTAATLMSACTPSEPTPTPSTAPSSPAASDTPSPSPTPSETGQPDYISTIAYVNGTEIEVSDTPGGEPTQTITAEDVLTVPEETPLVLLVKSATPDAFEVYLPIRPNGSTGWIDPTDVTLYQTSFVLDVYLADHELTISKEGEVVATYPIGTGADDLPTPGGVYFIRELLAPPDPTGPYGPYAYGLSGYSPVLDNFNGGDAVIGIHGTDDPASIGGNVSHGCIRMNNADITQLVQDWQLPLGVPVHIHE